MPLPSFTDLFAQADRRRPALPVACAGGADRTVLEALAEARQRGWVEPVVTGREDEIRALGIDLSGFHVIDTDEPARAAVAEARGRPAALLMQGQIAPPPPI